MAMIRNILFPLDFSPRSLGAVPFVEAMAKRFQARLTIRNVVERFTYPGMIEPGASIYVEPEELRTESQTRLDAAFEDECVDVPSTRIAVVRVPASEITSYCHQIGVGVSIIVKHR